MDPASNFHMERLGHLFNWYVSQESLSFGPFPFCHQYLDQFLEIIYLLNSTLTQRSLTEDSGYPSSVIERLLSYYPESGVAEPLEPPIGSISDKNTFERVKKVIGDIEMNAAQRLVCGSFSTSATCFNFIFNVTPAWQRDSRVGVPHGAEIASLFQNLDGLGFDRNSLHGKGPGYYEMSSLMGTMWAGFITTLDPNAVLKQGVYNWPRYESVNRHTLVFDEVNVGLTIQDTYREDALRYISENFAGVFDK